MNGLARILSDDDGDPGDPESRAPLSCRRLHAFARAVREREVRPPQAGPPASNGENTSSRDSGAGLATLLVEPPCGG